MLCYMIIQMIGAHALLYMIIQMTGAHALLYMIIQMTGAHPLVYYNPDDGSPYIVAGWVGL